MTTDTTRAYDPLILQRPTGDAWAQFMRFLGKTGAAEHAALTQQESERLAPYFAALEQRVGADMAKGTVTYRPMQSESPQGKKLGETFRSLFNAVAADTQNIILSEFSILPVELLEHPNIDHLRKKEKIELFMKNTLYNETPISMGFIQIRNDSGTPSASVPILGLPGKICAALLHIDATPVLEPLREILTAGNHDMMHHLTNTFLNSNISSITAPPPYAKPLADFLNRRTHGGDNEPKGYEGWALASHVMTWRELDKSGGSEAIKDNVEKFYAAVTHIESSLRENGTDEKTCRNTTGYFTTLCQFALMRFLPITHPVMQYALQQTQAADQNATADNIGAILNDDRVYSRIAENPELQGRALNALYDIADAPMAFVHDRGLELFDAVTQHNRKMGWAGEEGIDSDDLQSALMKHHFKEGEAAHKTQKIKDTILNALHIICANPHDMLNDPQRIRWEKIKSPLLHRFDGDFETMTDSAERSENLEALSLSLAQAAIAHIAATPALRERHADLITDCFKNHVARLQQETDNAQGYWEKQEFYHPSLLVRTLMNYQDSGHPLLDADDLGKTAKIIRLIQTGPDIAFLASPDDKNRELQFIRKNAHTIDSTLPSILKDSPSLRASP